MTYFEIDKILTADGWCFIGTVGSHCCYLKNDTGFISIPDDSLTISVIKDIERKTGLSLRR